jgi:hypothetical protein
MIWALPILLLAMPAAGWERAQPGPAASAPYAA